MQKAIILICDGMPDRPLKDLGNKTPLELASTPNLDRLAVDGLSGMMHTVGVGIRPGSDTAHLALFGYDPYVDYAGRGPYECAGIGMEVLPGDIAFRANAGTVDEHGIITDRRAGRIASTKEVVEYLGEIKIDDVTFLLQPSLGHRIGLVMRGPGLSPRVTDQDPHKTGGTHLEVTPVDSTVEAAKTAKILNQFTKLVTEKLAHAPFNEQRVAAGQLPANTVLFRGAGSIPEGLMSFENKYHLNAAFVAGAPLYQGIAKILGMDIATFPPEAGVTGLANSNIRAKIDKAIEMLTDHEIVFVHIKAADSLAEDGNHEGKIAFIEKLDQALAPLFDVPDCLIVVTADHTTSCQLKMHTADPVPVVLCGEGIRTDDINAFSERECARGRLGTIRGQNLMPIVVDLMGLAELFGA